MSLDLDFESIIKEIPDEALSGTLGFELESITIGDGEGHKVGSPASTHINTDEGEFETLVNSYHSGYRQPRSGPLYKEHDRFGGESLSFYKDYYHEDRSPTLGDKDTKDALENARIPISVQETYRLISQEEPVSVEFQDKMTDITHRLFKANYGAQLHNFRFAISDEDTPNACILTSAKPPIIIVSKALIQACDNEDELAAALAHELTHQNIFDRIGQHSNSNPEEASSDAWAVHLLQEAGYNPSAILTLMDKIHPSFARRRKTALEAKEPHPAYPTRRRHIEDVLGYFESKKKLNTELTPFDEELKRKTSDAQHFAYIATELQKREYLLKDAEGKVQVLCELFDNELKTLSCDQFFTRFEDFETIVLGLAETVREQDPRLFDPLLDRVLKFSTDRRASGYRANMLRDNREESLFASVSKGYQTYNQDKEHGYAPIGPLGDLRTAMTCFMEAETREDAVAFAETINKICDEYDFSGSHLIICNIHWPDFQIQGIREVDRQLQAGETCQLPWNKHVQWSQKSIWHNSDESEQIRNALSRFAINNSNIEQTTSQTIQQRPIEWSRYGYTPDKHLTFDKRGQITGHNIRRIKKELPKVKRFDQAGDVVHLSERDKEAEELLKTIDWADLKTDFWGFIAKHKDQLMPQITSSSGGDKFQAAFCDQLRFLLNEDQSKFRPLVDEFFARKTIPEIKEDEHDTYASMLYEFGQFHNVHAGIRAHEDLGTHKMGLRKDFGNAGGRAFTPKTSYEYGLSHDGPYAKFLLQDMQPDPKQALATINNLRWRGKIIQTPEDIVNVDFRELLGYEKPQSADDLYETLEYIDDIFGYNGAPSDLRKAITNAEIYAYLELKRDETLDIERLATICGKDISDINKFFQEDYVLGFSGHSLMSLDEKNKHTNRFAQLMDRQIECIFHANPGETKTAAELVNNYRILCFGNWKQPAFFDRKPDEKAQYEIVIKNKINDLDNPTEKIELLRSLLCDMELKNPDFRLWAVREWIKTQGQILNQNIETADAKFSGLEKIADDIITNAKMGQSVDMLNGLLEETLAQQDDCFMVRDKLVAHFLRKGSKGNLAAAANDYVLERIGDEPKIRDELLEFLTSPLSEDNIDTFAAVLKSSKIDRKYGDDMLSIFQKDKDARGIEITETTRINALSNVHKNFWALPFAARTVYLERVLFPIGEDDEAKFDQAVKFASDKILPEGEPYMDHARLILTTHLEQCSKPLQRLIFSALITANEQNNESDDKLRPGQILSQVLQRSGAAGGKILQAIHSYLQSLHDPDEELLQFIDDLKSSKSNYNKPYRWDMISRFDSCYTPRTDRAKPQVGKQLGSGSYGFTVELLYPDESTACTLAREDVGEEADYQFGLFKNTAVKLSKINPMWKPLISILDNAQGMSAVESDFEIAAEQIQTAEELYNGLTVKVDGYLFDISTATLHHFGKEFKETELAQGEHFIDLEGDTPEQKKYKRAVSIANLTAEIHCLLKGGPFDYDRHGAQGKAKEHKIKLFDHGSIPYDLENKHVITPTAEDKKALGGIIAEAFREAQFTDGSMSDVLIAKLTEANAYGESQNYIECFKRGILALSDHMKEIADTPDERNEILKQIIMESVKTGLVDQDIVGGVLENIDLAELQTKATGKSSVKIQLRDDNGPSFGLIKLGLAQAFSKSAINSLITKGKRYLGIDYENADFI